jgi:hypothetical protein
MAGFDKLYVKDRKGILKIIEMVSKTTIISTAGH